MPEAVHHKQLVLRARHTVERLAQLLFVHDRHKKAGRFSAHRQPRRGAQDRRVRIGRVFARAVDERPVFGLRRFV